MHGWNPLDWSAGGMAVALLGPAVLAGTTLDPFHRMYANSSGGCGSDGDGDGGGGGCGGCGD